MEVPPGILYLIPRLPRILSPPVLTYAFGWVLKSSCNVNIPTWLLSLAVFASFPIALTIVVHWGEYSVRRDAARFGAVLPPRCRNPGFSGLIGGVKVFTRGYPGDKINELCEELGYTFNRRVFFENRIFTADPEHIKVILATQFDDFEKGPEIRYLFSPLLGTGVFASDGGLWKFHRSMTRPFFSRDRISHFDNFDRHADHAIRKLKYRLAEGFPVDFQDLISRFTLDSATEFLFGNDVGSLSSDLPYPFYASNEQARSKETLTSSSRFVSALSQAQSITAFRMRFGVHWPLMEFWMDRLKKPMRVVHAFIEPIVADAIKKKREMERQGGLGKNKDDETLLENLVNSTEDLITLRDEIMSLLVAGRDTTASTLTFIVYMLAEHPEVLNRLRNEILEKIGSQRRPSYDDFRDMRYLRAVINETLRLYPAVPFNVRMSKKATTLPNRDPNGKPFYVPPNTRLPFAVFMMHRRTDLWGPDALDFDPDRFLDSRLQEYLTKNPFIFLPFLAGPRICLGQQFAYHEASFFLVRLLQRFSAISLAPQAQPPESRPPMIWKQDQNVRKANEKVKPKNHLTMYVQDGLWVTMKEANSG